MFATSPRGKWFVFFAALAATLLINNSALATDTSEAVKSSRLSANRQLAQMRRSLAYIKRSLNNLKSRNNSLSQGVTDIKSSLSTLTQRVITGTSVEPSNPQVVIGTNTPAPNYITFDFYPGAHAEAITQHNGTGIAVVFRSKEGIRVITEYKLILSFEGRTADQKAADAMMVNACLTNFYRAADARDGGSFFIYPSADNKLGLSCSSTTNP